MKFTETVNLSGAGLSIQATTQREAVFGTPLQVTLDAAHDGDLTTRTDDDEGVITTDAAHGLSVGEYIDVFWVGGRRYNMIITAVTANTITFGGVTGPGAGDVLPAQDTAVVTDERQSYDVDFDGDNLQAIVVVGNYRGQVVFVDSTPTVLDEAELLAKEPSYRWIKLQSLGANPLTGNPVDKVYLSNADVTNSNLIQMITLIDAAL